MVEVWSALRVDHGTSVTKEPTEFGATIIGLGDLKVAFSIICVLWVRQVPAVDQIHRVLEDELIVGYGEEGRRNVHEDTDPAVALVRERFCSNKSGSDHSSAQIPSQIGRDGDVGKRDDHSCVGKTNHEGSRCRRDERVCLIQCSPDDHPDERVHEEFDEKQLQISVRSPLNCAPCTYITQSLGFSRICAENSDKCAFRNTRSQKCCELLVIHAPDEETGDKSPENLSQNITDSLKGRKALEDGKSDRDCRIEVTSGYRGRGDNGVRDSKAEGKANIKQRTGDSSIWSCRFRSCSFDRGEGQCRCGGYSRKHIEEDTGGLCSQFT